MAKIDSIVSMSLNQVNRVNSLLAAAAERVSTGSQINRASDDPSGYFRTRLLEHDIRLADSASQNAEREQLQSRSISSRLDIAADLATELTVLTERASNSLISDQERNALQNQASHLSLELGQILEDSGLGDASSFGLDPDTVILNQDSNTLKDTKSQLQQVLTNILDENVSQGIQSRESARQLQSLAETTISLKTTKSTIQDTDIAGELTRIDSLTLLRETALNAVASQNQESRSILDLIG